ncbi:MAG TPA: hypothetical protein VG755_17520 [Nannocystaceae bacterium]|nr:hypothetical protein [Nannocystaceae bacterium]
MRWTSSLAVAGDQPDRAYSVATGTFGELYVAGVADLGPDSAPWIARLAP